MSASALPELSLATPSSFACAICSTQWPEHLTVKHGEAHLCCPCNDKLKDENFRRQHKDKLNRPAAKAKTKGKSSGKIWMGVALLILVGGGCGGYVAFNRWEDAKQEAAMAAKDFGPVMVESQLPLKSGATITNTAFLVKAAQGPVAVVPAAVLPDSSDTPLLDQWKFLAPSERSRTFRGTKLMADSGSSRPADLWIVDCPSVGSRKLPVTILELQKAAVASGVRVKLLRMTAVDGQMAQQASLARVEAVASAGAQLTISLKTRLPAKGLLGAPLLNANGELLGVIDGLAEKPDAAGTVGSVKAVGALALLGVETKPAHP
jgi:hypothetical protein